LATREKPRLENPEIIKRLIYERGNPSYYNISIDDLLVQGIDERFNQESTSIITGVGKVLKFELSKD